MPRAAVCRHFAEPLSVEQITLDPPGPDEVRIRVTACAICHSDVAYAAGDWGGTLPAVFGHEACGVVVEAGPGVVAPSLGDRVVVGLVRSCGRCARCREGAPALCDARFRLDDASPIVLAGGERAVQGLRCGAFADEVVVHASQAVAIPDGVPDTSACLIACAVMTGMGAAARDARVRPGETVVVIGAGGVGLNAIQGAKWKGAERIIAVDRFDSKLDMAKQFGATDLVNAGNGDPVAQVQELTAGRGVDVSFEVIGLKDTVQQAFAMARRGGQAIIVGVPKMEQIMEIPIAMELLVNEKQVRGSWYGSSDVRRDVPRLVDLYKEGTLKLDELVSRRIGLDGINDAFTSMEAGEVARSVVDYGI
jgi:Zn-dependent alcohol dehydrogenase